MLIPRLVRRRTDDKLVNSELPHSVSWGGFCVGLLYQVNTKDKNYDRAY